MFVFLGCYYQSFFTNKLLNVKVVLLIILVCIVEESGHLRARTIWENVFTKHLSTAILSLWILKKRYARSLYNLMG